MLSARAPERNGVGVHADCTLGFALACSLQSSVTRLKITTTAQTRSRFSPPEMAKIAVVTLCTLAFGLNAAAVFVTLTTDRYVGSRDFITYWAAGQRLVRHGNPYDARALLPIERMVGFSLT